MNINIQENRGIPLNLFINSKQGFDFPLFSSFVHLLAILEKQRIIIADLDLSIFEVCEDNTIKIADLSCADSFQNLIFKKVKKYPNNVFCPPEAFNQENARMNLSFANSYTWGIIYLFLIGILNTNDKLKIEKINTKYKIDKLKFKKFLKNLSNVQYLKTYTFDQRNVVIFLLKKALRFCPEKRPTFLEMERILDPNSEIKVNDLKYYFSKKNTFIRYINYLKYLFIEHSQYSKLLSDLFQLLEQFPYGNIFEIAFKEYFPNIELIQNVIEDKLIDTFLNLNKFSSLFNYLSPNNEPSQRVSCLHIPIQDKSTHNLNSNILSKQKKVDSQYLSIKYLCNLGLEEFCNNYHNILPEEYQLLNTYSNLQFNERNRETKINAIFDSFKIDKSRLILILFSDKWNFKEFDLNSENILRKIFEILPSFPFIRELKFTYYDFKTSRYEGNTGGIGNDGILFLYKNIKKKNYLTTLNISAGPSRKNPFSSNALGLLNQTLECLVELESLDLSFNIIEDKGMALLGSGFKSVTKLKKLNLEGTLIGNIGLMFLRESAIDYNFSHLNLSGNMLSTFVDSSQDPKENLCNLIRKSSRLIYLDISFNQLEKKQLIDIILLLNSALNYFQFSKNFICLPNKCSMNGYQEIENLNIDWIQSQNHPLISNHNFYE